MGVKNITSEGELDTLLSSSGSKLIVIDFYADWCGPCRVIAPKIVAMSEEKDNENVIFVKINVDECDDIAQKYEITAMPTFKFFKDGAKVDDLVGASVDKLKDLIKKNR